MDRESPIAGSWYEGTKEGLERQINSLFMNEKFGPGKDPIKQKREQLGESNVLGIVSPHAGYIYSGSVAAHGFSKIYEHYEKIDTAIILGPNHRGIGPPVSIYPEGKWNFPLGSLQIDGDLVDFTRNYDFGIITKSVEIERTAHIQEHSIDIQISFLQYLYKNNLKIFTICLADQSLKPIAENLSKFLYELLNHFSDKKIIIVASSDFSHEYDYDRLIQNDHKMIEYLEMIDLNEADRFKKANSMTMCGYGPVYTLLWLSQRIGNPQVKKLKYANSALVRNSVGGYTVGYTSMLVKAKEN